MSAAWWIVLGFLVLVVGGSYWLWRRSNEYDDYIDEVAPREYKTPPGVGLPPVAVLAVERSDRFGWRHSGVSDGLPRWRK